MQHRQLQQATAGEHWARKPVFALDFEGCERTGIVEYGVACLRGDRVVLAETGLCRPKSDLLPVDTATHGLRTPQLNEKASFETLWERFAHWRAEGCFLAHHAAVEDRLLRHYWPCARGGLSWGPWLDTRALYANVFDALESHKLSDLITRFELEDALDRLAKQWCPPARQRFHCALFDALASAVLLQALCRCPGFEAVTLDWLLDHSAASVEAFRQRRQSQLPL